MTRGKILPALLAACAASAAGVTAARADVAFSQTNIVSDGSVPAAHVDPDLINPWGVAFSATGPFWVSDNNAGVTTIYNGAGSTILAPVTIATPPGQTPGTGTPTGQIHNSGGGFNVTANGKTGSAAFVFATEDGTISGWNPTVDATHSVLAVDNSGKGAVYKGLATAVSGTQKLLYAANFNSGKVEVYDQNFALVNSFTDPTLPPGYAPFNVQVLNGKLYVTFALQDGAKHDDVAGAGHGFVDAFNLDGTGGTRVASGGALNSPWGLDIAPASLGQFAGDLLVGNFGDGLIHAFDPSSDQFAGTLLGLDGNPVQVTDLWAIVTGNGGSAGSANTLYVTAGLANEAHGLFASLTPIDVPEPAPLWAFALAVPAIALARRRG